MKKLIITLLSILVLLCLFGCQSKEEKEKIEGIKTELNSKIIRNLVLLNKEEYTITEIKQCKQKDFPLAEEEYSAYGINDETYFFEFTIQTTSDKESTLYVLYYNDREYHAQASEQIHYIEDHDDFRKFIIFAKDGSNQGVYFNFHTHLFQYNVDGKDLIYRCKTCGKIEQLYDVENESFITHEATEEERQERIETEAERNINRVKAAIYKYITIKNASSYEITDVTYNGSTYYISVKASNGQTGTIKGRIEEEDMPFGLEIYDSHGDCGNSYKIYDLAKDRAYSVLPDY